MGGGFYLPDARIRGRGCQFAAVPANLQSTIYNLQWIGWVGRNSAIVHNEPKKKESRPAQYRGIRRLPFQ